MDRIDRRILDVLQEDATLAVSDVADAVGLTTTPCWRRIQNLEAQGIIRKRVALVDRASLELGVDVFVAVKTSRHDAKWLEQFARTVSDFPEVVEFYRMSGDIDYLMRVVVRDIAAYDAFYQRLIRKVDLSDVSSSFAMERIKYTTAVPVT